MNSAALLRGFAGLQNAVETAFGALWIVFGLPRHRSQAPHFFLHQAKAEAYREALAATLVGERYFNPNTNPTVAEVVDHWLENKRGTVKPQTIRGYLPLLKKIPGA